MSKKPLKKILTSFQIIILGFLGVILLGALILMLPVSSAAGQMTPFKDTIFTATSAVCVTGLIVRDTATYWSAFGQAVILIMIQIGGLGVISIAAFIGMLSGRRVSLFERSMLQDTISAHQLGGILKLTGFLFRGTFLIELGGMLLLLPVFCSHYGLSGIWMSLFHSVSAFCNAGFDLMGSRTGQFSSLTGFGDSIWVSLVISLLIIVGGIGFLTWDDMIANKWHLKKYRMQSKVILATSAALIVVPMILFFFFDFADMPLKERICKAFFQAVTTRTAGFNTADFSLMTGAGRTLMIVLMIIGGSPGSTAGGMKTTTAAVLAANAVSVFRRKKSTEMFGRRIEDGVIKHAATLLIMYIALMAGSAMLISAVEQLPMDSCLFETASAVGTVGLTLGITPGLGICSRIVIMALMFLGRVGGLTLIYAASSRTPVEVSQRPVDKIVVG